MLLLLACSAPRPVALYDLDGAFYDSPWPSDLRMSEAGGPDMTGFPMRDELSLVDTYCQVIESTPGASTTAPLYLRFDGAVDTGEPGSNM